MKLGYIIIYASDVPRTVAFYETAFDLKRQFIYESQLYAEKETGSTALAFAGNQAAEMAGLGLLPNDPRTVAAGWEICLSPVTWPKPMTRQFPKDAALLRLRRKNSGARRFPICAI